MHTTEITIEIDTGGNSTLIAMTAATSAQGPVVTAPTNWPINTPVPCIFTPDNTCYVRKGANPTALNTGVDIRVMAGNTYRTQLLVGERLAFISTPGGTVSFTQMA